MASLWILDYTSTRSAESGNVTRMSMEVIVLAGGFGTRLRPLTENRVKPLLQILDKSLLQRVVEVVPTDMIERVIVAAGFGISEMREWVSEMELPYEVTLSVEEEAMGTGGALALAREHLKGKGPVLILNGDLIVSVNVSELLRHHHETGALATLSLWEVEDPSRFGVCELNDEGFITRFQEKPEAGTEFSNLINAGCYLVEREVLENMAPEKHSMEREVFPKIAASGGMAGMSFQGYFVDAGTPPSFIQAAKVCIDSNRFSSGIRCCESWFADGSRFGDVTRSSIGSNVHLGESSLVVDSVIMDNAWIGDNCKLNDCIIGEGAKISDGSVISGKVVGHYSQA